MSDRREQILVKLFEIVSALFPADSSFRNQTDIPEVRPCFVLMDGDESADSESTAGRGRPARGPSIVTMTPEIHFIEEGEPEEIGPKVNSRRAQIIKAITTDSSLVALCKDGELRYEGFASDLSAGRTAQGIAGLSFAFVYVLYPEKL